MSLKDSAQEIALSKAMDTPMEEHEQAATVAQKDQMTEQNRDPNINEGSGQLKESEQQIGRVSTELDNK